MTILIPAYEPNNRLIKLIEELREVCSYNIVIVDDGSGEDFKNIFKSASEMGCKVLVHEINKGKGKALKTGFNYIREMGEGDGVVCGDCDGQHLPRDIIKIAESIEKHTNCVILGTRRFIGKVPLRSSLGNAVTRGVFAFSSGTKIYDTQTGLRGFSFDMLPWLCEIPGNRFEYEMNMLLETVPAGYGFHEIDIDTVYLEKNKSSHFRPLKDSFRVYLPFLKFSMSSIISGMIDFILLGLLQVLTSNLFLSVVGARTLSAIFNYSVNRFYVFSRFKGSSIKKSLPRYFLIVIIVMLANYGVINTYYRIIGLSLFLAKIFTEITIFLFSFWSQRKFVFKN